MKTRFKLTAIAVLLISISSIAGFRALNSSGLNLGDVTKLKCGNGVACSVAGGILTMSDSDTSGAITMSENGEVINNTLDDTVEILSDDNNTTLQITGFEAKTANLNLYADQGDDAADKFSLNVSTGDIFAIKNNGTSLLSFTSAGLMTLPDSETINNASDVITFGFDDAAANVKLNAFEATDAILTLQADESDDNGDDWALASVASGNAFTISNDASGSQVAKFSISASAGNVSGPGTGTIVGFLQPLVAATATTITAAQCGSTFYNTGAVQMELPEASAVLGCTLTFVTLNASNFDLNPDNADQILTQTNSVGDATRNATVGNSITLRALSASQWAVIAINGTWSDIN